MKWVSGNFVALVSMGFSIHWTFACIQHFEPILFLRAVLALLISVTLLKAKRSFVTDSDVGTKAVVVSHLFLPLLLQPVSAHRNTIFLSFVMIGILVSALGILDIGSSFGVLPAVRTLKTGGLYGHVRHPIYFGYVFSILGWCLYTLNWRNFIVLGFYMLLTIVRINKEESLLSTISSGYEQYKANVNYRLIPGIY